MHSLCLGVCRFKVHIGYFNYHKNLFMIVDVTRRDVNAPPDVNIWASTLNVHTAVKHQ